jgi:hypothetical protein
VGGKCIYPRYQLSFTAPPSPTWSRVKRLPAKFTPSCPDGFFRPLFYEFTFENNTCDGVIALGISGKEMVFRENDPKETVALICQKLQRDKRLCDAFPPQKNAFMSNYVIEILPLSDCETSLPVDRHTFKLKAQKVWYQCESISFLCSSSGLSPLYFFNALLISEPDSFEMNKRSFDALVATFARGDVYQRQY